MKCIASPVTKMQCVPEKLHLLGHDKITKFQLAETKFAGNNSEWFWTPYTEVDPTFRNRSCNSGQLLLGVIITFSWYLSWSNSVPNMKWLALPVPKI